MNLLPNEIAVPVVGYEEHYLVTTEGRVFTLRKNRFMKAQDNMFGYLKVSLFKDKKLKSFKVATLVANAFLTKDSKNLNINHKNGNKHDNRLDNLEYTTQSQNCRHALHFLKVKRTHRDVFLTEKEVVVIKKLLKCKTPHQKIAKLFDCSRAHITNISNGKNWSQVKID